MIGTPLAGHLLLSLENVGGDCSILLAASRQNTISGNAKINMIAAYKPAQKHQFQLFLEYVREMGCTLSNYLKTTKNLQKNGITKRTNQQPTRPTGWPTEQIHRQSKAVGTRTNR